MRLPTISRMVPVVAMAWLMSAGVVGVPAQTPPAVDVLLTLSDSLSLTLSAYVPYGRPPRGSILASEYGGTPLSGFLQVRIYG